jgi:hypothetical protein
LAVLAPGSVGVVVLGVGESVGEDFPLAVAAPPPHRPVRALLLEAVEGGEHERDGVRVVVVAISVLVCCKTAFIRFFSPSGPMRVPGLKTTTTGG